MKYTILAVAVLCVSSSQVMGLVEYNDGGTHTITTNLYEDVWVDWNVPGMGTTVINNGWIDNPYIMQGFNDCILILSNGGSQQLRTHDNTNITISSGGFTADFRSYDNSQVAITNNGEVSSLRSYGNSQITMLNGRIDQDCHTYDNSQMTFSGGTVKTLQSQDSSQVTMSGGTMEYNLTATDTSQVTMSGGTIWGGLYATDGSQVNWSGGTVGGFLYSYRGSDFTINGVDFAIDGVPIEYGNITSMLGGVPNNEPWRTLTGTLANGDAINNLFKVGDTAKIILVPPPGIFTLTIATEPNDIGIDTIVPGIGDNNDLGGVVDITVGDFPDCPHTWVFDHWDGDVADPNSASTTIDMDSDKTITAFFNRANPTCGDVCHPILKGDLNQDCHTNMQDFRIWADSWMICTHPNCD